MPTESVQGGRQHRWAISAQRERKDPRFLVSGRPTLPLETELPATSGKKEWARSSKFNGDGAVSSLLASPRLRDPLHETGCQGLDAMQLAGGDRLLVDQRATDSD